VSGVDTNNNVNGIPGSTSDTWIVTSAQRFCNITSFSLAQQTQAEPGETYSRTFIASGFDKDCGCTVTTSDVSNSFLRIGNRVGSSLTVSLGETVEINMICPYFDSVRTTTVTLTSSFGTSRQATFTITPKAPPLPELTLDATPRNTPFIFPTGGSTVLSYSYNYVTNSNVTTNFGVSSIAIPQGSGTRSISNILTTTTYSMTVSNSTGSVTKTVQVTVGDPPTPIITLCPSDTSSCSNISKLLFGSSITLYWKSQNATTISSTDFNTNNSQNGNVTISNLTQDNRIFTITATGPGGTASATHTVDLTPSVRLTADNTNLINGKSTTLRWSSNLATTVVSSSGFNAGGNVNGSVTVSPTTTTVYAITVRDNDGNQISSSVRIDVSNDTTVDSFSFSPSSFSSQELNATVVSQPSFTNGGSQVSGLSPGVSVTATVRGTGAQFESGGTSKTVQNGTATSSLRVSLTNSSSFGSSRTATLTIGGVSASFNSRTKTCVVQNSSGTVDSAITINTRNSSNYGAFLATGLSGGSSIIPRSATNAAVDTTYGVGTYNITLPNGTTNFYAAAIGGGGGGGSTSGCTNTACPGGGGGGAAWGELVGNYSGVSVTIVVGGGGNGSTTRGFDGGNSSVLLSVGGQTTPQWFAAGGKGSFAGNIGPGGTGNRGPGGTSNGASGGPVINGERNSKHKKGGGGGGAGFINGGSGLTGTRFCNIGDASGGNGGQGGNINGGVGDSVNTSASSKGGTSFGVGECYFLFVGNNCGRGGGNGRNYGGGGGGGAQAKVGGTAAAGRVRIRYSSSFPQVSYFTLCTQIMRAYWDKLNRPPTVSEIQTWVNNFKNNPATYPTAASIYNAISGTRGVSPLDNCGNTFPRYP
jgi:hypothetical protein